MGDRPKILRDDGVEEELPDGFQVEEIVRIPKEIRRAWEGLRPKRSAKRRYRRPISKILASR